METLFSLEPTVWEGVSVSGEALRMVLIPRLPFRVPTEPVQLARYERLESLGLDPFRNYASLLFYGYAKASVG